MSLSVNHLNTISFKSNEKPISNNKSSVASPPPESEKGLSTEGKVFVGLGAAAAAVIGGILVKRRIEAKATEKLAQKAADLLQKPKEFSYDNLRSYADELFDAKKLSDNDEIILMGKSLLNELAENEKNRKSAWTKLFKAMNMSDNGFAVLVRKSDKSLDMSTFKYFDPEKITEPQIVQSLKDGKIVVMPIKD